MKILFISGEDHYLLGLPSGFEALGCRVEVLHDIEERELDKVFRESKPDLLLTAGWTEIHTTPKREILARLVARHKVRHAYWATEDPRWTEVWSLPFVESTGAQLIFTIDRNSVPFYRKRGYSAYYLTWACNPRFHRPAPAEEAYKSDISLVATAGVSWDSYRRQSAQILLEPLLDKGYKVAVWGDRWHQLDTKALGFAVGEHYLCGILPYRETNKVYSSSKIVLGFQNSFSELTARTYEILAAKAFLLAPATWAVFKTFQPGSQLAVSRFAEETRLLAEYYLNRPDERNKIAAQGQAEVYAKHTYAHRAAEILNIIS